MIGTIDPQGPTVRLLQLAIRGLQDENDQLRHRLGMPVERRPTLAAPIDLSPAPHLPHALSLTGTAEFKYVTGENCYRILAETWDGCDRYALGHYVSGTLIKCRRGQLHDIMAEMLARLVEKIEFHLRQNSESGSATR